MQKNHPLFYLQLLYFYSKVAKPRLRIILDPWRVMLKMTRKCTSLTNQNYLIIAWREKSKKIRNRGFAKMTHFPKSWLREKIPKIKHTILPPEARFFPPKGMFLDSAQWAASIGALFSSPRGRKTSQPKLTLPAWPKKYRHSYYVGHAAWPSVTNIIRHTFFFRPKWKNKLRDK